MSAPRIYLDRFPSFCQKFSKFVEFNKVLTKTNLLSFFGTRCSKQVKVMVYKIKKWNLTRTDMGESYD